jgi:hypothetical protein
VSREPPVPRVREPGQSGGECARGGASGEAAQHGWNRSAAGAATSEWVHGVDGGVALGRREVAEEAPTLGGADRRDRDVPAAALDPAGERGTDAAALVVEDGEGGHPCTVAGGA